MATRSNIRVILKEEDRNKDMKFNPEMVNIKDNAWRGYRLETGLWEEVNAGGKDAFIIYHHWDGYPEGVGKTLLNEYNDYDKALNLVLGGDASTINGGYEGYALREGENWEDIKPRAVDESYAYMEEYDYMFKDGKWFVKSAYGDKLNDWTELETVLKNV